MSQAIPGVEPCLDFAHLHARPGDGSMNTYDEWALVLEKLGETLGEGRPARYPRPPVRVSSTPKRARRTIC